MFVCVYRMSRGGLGGRKILSLRNLRHAERFAVSLRELRREEDCANARHAKGEDQVPQNERAYLASTWS